VANTDRQRLTAETLTSAKEKLGDATQPLLMVGDVDYIPGVLGVVANKLVDEFYRPAIVFQVDNEIVRGSGRSIREFDLLAALNKCSDLFTRFGGHARAAGFTIPRANMEQLHKQLLEIAEPLADADLCPTLFIDAEVPLSEISGGIYRMISKLEPFGQANPVPTLLSRRVKLISYRFIGNNGKHLKLKLRDGPIVWDAIVFNHNEQQMSSYLDIVYNLEEESWGGRETLRLNIIDFAPAS
ncbi:DHHA1 domain-containing protein, partial [Chloroflexota bacterium]